MHFAYVKMPLNDNMIGGMEQMPYFDMFNQVKKEEVCNIGPK